jgi:ABC-type multidrug transport system fused ATPase/permease subunit
LTTPAIVTQLVELAKPERNLLAGALVALVASSTTNLVFPYAIGQVIDNVMPPERYTDAGAAIGKTTAVVIPVEAVPVEAIAVLDPYMFSGLASLFFIAAGRSVECSIMEGKKLVNNRVL